MPDDLIRRSDAKAVIRKERLECIEVGAIGAANTCDALLEALDSLPAADGRWEERPPMLRAQHGDAMHWWIYDPVAHVWVSNTTPSSRSSCNLCEVDRTASDPEALKLYDADLTSRHDAER